MKRLTKSLAILALLPSLAFGAGTVSFLDGVSAFNPSSSTFTAVNLANNACIQWLDVGGTNICVLKLDTNDDFTIGNATGVDNIVFDVATSGTYSFDVNGTPRFSISAVGGTVQGGANEASTYRPIGSSGVESRTATGFFLNRLGFSRSADYTIQTENAAADVSTFNIDIIAQAALAAAVTNLDGGDINLTGGAGASGSGGDADGGNVVLTGGAAFGIGTAGLVQLINAGANTDPIAELENTAGDIQLFRTDATPESSVTGSIGDLAVDGTGGVLYIKNTGSGTNTGWEALSITDAYSSMWFHGPASTLTISTQNAFTKITTFVNVGAEDSGGNVVGDATTDDDFTVSLAGTYELDIQASSTNAGGGTVHIDIAPLIILNSAKTITDATNATPIVVTSAGHGLLTGDGVEQSGVGGNTAANGDFWVTRVTDNTYSLQDLSHVNVAGNGAYTSGGTVDSFIPGNIVIDKLVSNTALERGAAEGTVVLEAGDIVEATAINQDGTDNVSFEQLQFGVERIGNGS